MSRARVTGKPAIVTAETTPRSMLTAQPDGQLKLTSNVLPVRVFRHGTWVSFNTRLRPAAGGGWAPAIVSRPEVFSGGGPGPLVTVTDPASGHTVRVWWPAALPRPVVTGSAALYRGVLPGVDLRLEATDSGYNEVLIVRDATAAANPALLSLRLRVQAAPGLSVAQGPGGSLAVIVAATGQTILAFGRPQMWDSSHARPFGMPATADYAGYGRVTGVPVAYQRTDAQTMGILIRPPAAALAGPKVRYPVFIDPDTEPTLGYYAQLMAGYQNSFTEAWNTTTKTTSQGSGVTEIGFCGYGVTVQSNYPCDWAGFVGYTDRDYFQFPTSAIKPRPDGATAQVEEVHFNDEQMYDSNGCVAQPSAIYSTPLTSAAGGNINSSTSWGGPQGSQIAVQYSDAGGDATNCPPRYVDFSSVDPDPNHPNTGLQTTLQAVANAGDPTVTLELRAKDETNTYQYKTYMDNPTLTVYYIYPPSTPDNLTVSNGVTCDSSMTYLSTVTPTLSATDLDNNPNPLNVQMDFSLGPVNGTSQTVSGWRGQYAYQPSLGYAPGHWPLSSAQALTYGTAYSFQVKAENVPPAGDPASVTSLQSAWSPDSTPFMALDPTALAKPSISSFDYPQNQWGQPVGALGTFTVGTGGSSNIAGFAYSFDGGAGSEPVPSQSDCTTFSANGGLGNSVQTATGTAGLGSPYVNGSGASGELALVRGSTAQIVIPSNIPSGIHTLYVVSFDKAHNKSGEQSYTFYIPQNYQTSVQGLQFLDPSQMNPTSANQSLLWYQSNCCGVSWRNGQQLGFKGNAVGQSFTLSFSVKNPGMWQLGAEMTLAGNYAQQEIVLDQNTSAPVTLAGTDNTPWDGYGPVSLQYLDLGTPWLAAGTHTLTFIMTGKDSASGSYYTGVSFITLSPTSRYEGEDFTASSPGSQCVTSTPATPPPPAAGAFSWPSGQAAVPHIGNAGWPWSGHSQLTFPNTAKGASFTLSFYAPVNSDYALGVNLVTAKDYGQLQFTLDPSTVNFNLNTTAYYPGMENTTIDEYSPTISSEYVFLGGASLAQGMHCLQVTVTGTNSASSGNRYNAGIDYLEAVPVTGPVYSSFTTAMNNLGIATDGASSFAGSFDGTNVANLSLNALHDAGIYPGTAGGQGNSFSLHGASFTMPQLNAASSSGPVLADNVIADGQTIQIPPVYASDVALLVATTCGTSPAMNATLSYAGGSASQPALASVPNWYGGPISSTTIVLDHADNGTSPNSRQPRLYEVILPANPNLQVTSVGLPVMPGNYLSETVGCGNSPELHVLAIGARTVPVPGSAGTVWTGIYSAPMNQATVPPGGSASVSGETLREAVAVSAAVSGQQVRVRLSNDYSTQPVTFDDVTIAAQAAAGGPATVTTPQQLKFTSGSSIPTTVTIPAGGDVYSDPVPAPTGGSGLLTVTLHIAASPPVTSVPVHDSANVATYYASGDDTGNVDGTTFSSANSTLGLYYVSGIDVSDPTTSDGTIAVLGDQTAAAAPAWTQGTWPAALPAALAAAGTQGVPLPGTVANVSTSGTSPDHWWQLNDSGLAGQAIAFDSGPGPWANLTLGGTAGWGAGPPSGTSAGSLLLDGSAGYAATSGPVVNTTGSFTVSAWVKLTSTPNAYAAAVAQDANTSSGFILGYASNGTWELEFPTTDTTSTTSTIIHGPAAVAGTWTHLAGVYDASTNTATLYVNGVSAGSATVTPISATGPFEVGRARWDAGFTDYFPGNISDVREFNSKLYVTGVSRVFNDTGTSAITSGTALAAFSSSVAAEPNLRDVIIAVGANDVLQGVSFQTLQGNLGALVSAIGGYNDSDTGAATQAILTTIPPLGLPANDPRENVRTQINNWIMGRQTPPPTCTPNGVDNAALNVDVACAVQSSASPNLINSALLSNGVPTAAYYTKISTEIAGEIYTATQGPPYFGGL